MTEAYDYNYLRDLKEKCEEHIRKIQEELKMINELIEGELNERTKTD